MSGERFQNQDDGDETGPGFNNGLIRCQMHAWRSDVEPDLKASK